MGTKEGALKSHRKQIEKYGSVEAWKLELAKRGRKGGHISKRKPLKGREYGSDERRSKEVQGDDA